VNRAAPKRERSESPVKKNSAFAQWEAREKDEQAQQDQTTPKPARKVVRPSSMDGKTSPKKTQEDEWRNGLTRPESRSALSTVAPNTLPDSPSSHRRGKSHNDLAFRPAGNTNNEVAQQPLEQSPTRKHSRGQSLDVTPSLSSSIPSLPPPSATNRNSLATLSRSDSMRASTRPRSRGHVRFGSVDAAVPHLDDKELATLQNSTTPQLRHLSKFAHDGAEDLSVHSPEEQVVGLTGRRRLQRSGSMQGSHQRTQSSFGSQWQSTKWMDTQRKHLQAYEYLCHIGEARAWIEDVLVPDKLPPIVQLEESLRNGVTLAEVVNRLSPNMEKDLQNMLGSLRIFRSPRLQYRHSDNIAMFFRFVSAVELPELFRFELVDLYEKKNVPKVIYCIHALSWLLYRRGITSFTISHLVGQLEFTGEELEETQKGIDRSGVKMPDFGGMRKELDIPEPPPPPQPTPEELLREQEDVIADMQSQIRGALARMRLGDVMQDLWDAEMDIAHLQARMRGGFAREVFNFRASMDQSTRALQAAAKAMLVRQALRKRETSWASREGTERIVKIQSLWRGRRERAETKKIKTQLRAQRYGVKELQAAIRGTLGRWKATDTWEETRNETTEAAVADLQAAARGALSRKKLSDFMQSLYDVEDLVCRLQAAARGSRVRQQAKGQRAQAKHATLDIARLQAAARGLLHRKEQSHQYGERQIHEPAVVDLQAACRGLVTRLRQARTMGALQGREGPIVKMQSLFRAQLAKKHAQAHRAGLKTVENQISSLQAVARASMCRVRTAELKAELEHTTEQTIELQGLTRAMLERKRIGSQLAHLEDQEDCITSLQSFSRAYLERQRVFEQLVSFEKEEESICHLQAFARAVLVRAKVGNDLAEMEENEEAVVELQAATRAFMVRIRFEEKREHYRENMQKVVKLQSFVRARQQGKSYESLMKGANPPLPVVRKHLHLLTDSHFEFEGELEAERLRRLVVERVREVEQVEGYVEGLDVKVGLLVKNKISLDEVVKHQKHYGGSASQLLRNGGSIRQTGGGVDLKALNKSSRKKLSGYEELFFIMQTQPDYLARLFFQLSGRGLADKESKNLERLVLTLFCYAHKSREEYYFLRLLVASIEQFVRNTGSLDDFLRSQNGPMHQRLFLTHVRSPIHRSYLKSLLGGLVKDGICGQEHLDLESDPLQIHQAIINNEELSTGRASRRPRDLPRETIIRDPEVRARYVEHLQDLRDLCDGFFLSLEETLHRMPYGLRYLASSQFNAMSEQYPHEEPEYIATLVGNWIWKTYLLPAFREPEMWGVIDRGLSPVHKRNLGQVTLVLGQVCSSGRLFSNDNMYLQPLNSWIDEALARWQEALHNLFTIETPEEHFDADQMSDLYSRTKPTVYIKLSDIFQLHSLMTDNIAVVAPTREDTIKELLSDLGTPKGNEADLGNTGGGGEITLTLKSRYKVQEDPNADARSLFTATKRLVLFIIRVQSGSNLMEILLRPISHEDDEKWFTLVDEELAGKESRSPSRSPRKAYHQGAFDPRASMRGGRTMSVYSETASAVSDERGPNNLLDFEHMTYAELKSQALENILNLENPSTPPQYRVSRQNNYQEVLNALAADIRSKHRRRLERHRESDATRQTLAGLDKKAAYLEEQLTSYNDYIEQCLKTLANKKTGHKAFRLPFTKQWNHERELEKAGRQPKFGSYKYSARQLADKGVLLQWHAYPMDNWSQLNIVVSSDEVGVFHFEASSGSTMLPGASANVLLDDLLQAQYDNRNTIGIFEDGAGGSEAGAKLAVNLLLHLVFKKFYRDD
jgi:Ras GTPase-activating-like protein IQGAP2/3